MKAAPAISEGKVYVGDYAGEMYALNAVNGDVIWQSSGQGGSFGQAGRFYSSPAVAYGRVYASNVDSRVYSFDSENGDVAWTQSTGDWVYSGVVVGESGDTPAVFTGSFDHKVYAMDARTGEMLWTRDTGGIISGAGSIVGDVYYVSILAGKTFGYDTATGDMVFKFNKGEYNPVISDGEWIYLTGYSSVNAFQPKEKKAGKPKKGGPPKGKPQEKKGGTKQGKRGGSR